MCRVVVFVALSLASPGLFACSFVEATAEFQVTPGEVSVTPTSPKFEVVHIGRGRKGQPGSCFDAGVLILENQSPHSETTGYRFSIVDGHFEDGLFPEYPLITVNGTPHPRRYQFVWLDGDVDNQEPFDIVVGIVGVSLSGLESEAQLLRVSHGGRKKRWWQFWK